jgi:DNA-binding Lrp family transcriptional regulator
VNTATGIVLHTLCMPAGTPAVDALDARLLRLLDEHPRIGVLEASRRLGVARGTVQARLDRLQARGVVATLAPTLDPAALGFPLTAFATLEIRQGDRAGVVAHLARLPEVLEVHTITGPGDLLCRLVARDTEDLQRVLDELTGDADVVRSSTIVALSTVLPRRVLPLADAEARGRPAPPDRPGTG